MEEGQEARRVTKINEERRDTLKFVNKVAGWGVNVVTGLLGPAGKPIGYGFSLINGIAMGVAEGKGRENITFGVAVDIGLSAGLDLLPGGVTTGTKVIKEALGQSGAGKEVLRGSANSVIGNYLGDQVDKRYQKGS